MMNSLYRVEEFHRPADHGAGPDQSAEAAPGVAGVEPHVRVVALGQGEVAACPAASEPEA